MAEYKPNVMDSLAKLNRLQLLVDDYQTSRQQQKTPEIATWQEMGPLAAEVAVLAEFWGVSYGARPFSDVARNWWKCEDPEVLRATEELKAKLTAELWRTPGQPAEDNIPEEYRDGGKLVGHPLTVEYVSRPETFNLKGPFLARQKPKLQTVKDGRANVYLFSDIARLSAANNLAKNEGH